MDWKLFAQLLATVVVAGLGWWAVHRLAARRDLANERRRLRVAHLLEAYRKLESASNRDTLEHISSFESAIADIQLLGSAHQAGLARKFALDMAKYKTAPLDPLILDLRQSLRAELELDSVSEPIAYLRFSK
jgi:hypothetical protein